ISRSSGLINASGASAGITFGNTSALTLPAGLFNGNVNNLTLNGIGGVTLADATTINNALTLTSGNLTTGANILTLNGMTSGSGSIVTASNGTVVYGGSSAQTISNLASNAVNSLTIDNAAGVAINGNISATNVTINASKVLNVNAGKQLTVSTTMTNSGTLNLLSDASGTATIVTPASIGGTGGTSNVQQYLSGARNWYVSSPVTGATTPAGYTVYQYREPGDNTGYTGLATAYWESIAQGTALENGRGYIALPSSGPVTYTFSGTLNTGTITTGSLTRTTNASKLGFNLIGNPYPAFLNLASMDTTNVLGSFWLRSRNAQDTAYDFDTYNLKSELGISKSGKSITGYIPPMQAFWVRVKEGQSSTSLSFSNTMCDHENTSNNLFRAPSVRNASQQVLNLKISNGINTDETILAFNPNASNGRDAYDTPKMAINAVSIPEIFTVLGGEQTAINGMNSIPFDTEIPLGFTTGQAGNNFSISASQITNFDASVKIYLKDNQNLVNTPVLLTTESNYTFSTDVTNNNTTRFALIFKSSSVATDIDANVNQNTWISVNGTNQVIVNGVSADGQISVYNTIGQKLYSKNIGSGNTTLNTPLTSGV
ncbi:MAG: hypothetical protein WCQ44_11970, partial [Opitutaceae bacterium]